MGGAAHTMTGGILVAGENTQIPSLQNVPENTLSGGLGYDRMLAAQTSMRSATCDLPDGTLTGGLGASPRGPVQAPPRSRKFDDFQPVRPAAPKAPSDAALEKAVWKVGDTIEGKYNVTAIAGQGGMGVVYRVHHREWNIDMAVKTPLPALVKDAAAKARFLREAQIWVDLGLHPNLVQCWYVRELGGLPRVFVDYLAGGSLKDWLKQGRVGPGQWANVIDLAVQACDGLGYAHERGVVHRDIKPGNMLMSDDGRLCITDFGLVKVAGLEDIASSEDDGTAPAPLPESAELTRTGLSLGTPQYGAPEQWGQARHVDARADIYALGITLYEMCCGRRPFDESGKGEPVQIIIARHISSRPPDPRTFRPDLPAPLAELALKCLAKNPADRPQTLKEMRQALASAHMAILGAPLKRVAPEIAESRASGLNNRAVSMSDLGQPGQAETAWREALELDPHHAESIYNSSLVELRTGKITDFEAHQRLSEAGKLQRKALMFLGHVQLETCDAHAADKSFTEALTDPSLQGDGVAWRALGHAKLALEKYREAENAYANALVVMPNDEASLFGAAQARSNTRGANGQRLYPHISCARAVEDRIGSVRTVAVAPDGRKLYSDGALNSVCQFDLSTGRQTNDFSGHSQQVLCVAPTPDGLHLICGGEDSILRKWELASGVLDPDFYGKGHIGSVTALAISRDSRTAVTCGSDKSVRFWELSKGTALKALWAHDEAVFAVAFTPGGEAVVSGGNDAAIRFWEIPSGNPLAVLKTRVTPVRALAFSPDGRFLFSGGCDGRIQKWDCVAIASGQTNPCDAEFKGHRGTVNALACVPSGRFLISGGDDNTVRIWDAVSGRCLRTLKGHQGAVTAVAVTPDGTLAISGASENLGSPLRVWNLELERFTREPHAPDPYAGALYVCRVESQDKSQTASRQFKAHLNDASTAFEKAQYSAAYSALKQARNVEGYERDPPALELNAKLTQKLPLKSVAAAYLQTEIDGRHANGFRAIACAKRGTRALSIGRNDKTIGVWDLEAGALIRVLEGHKQTVEGIALTPDGSVLISASSDYSVGVWDVSSGTQKTTFQGHSAEVNAVAVSRDSRLAATASSDCTVKLWEIASGKCVKTFAKENSAEAFCAVKFMPDGRALLVGGRAGTVAIWSTVSGKCLREFTGHSGAIQDLAAIADKSHVLSAGEDKTLRLWNADNGQSIWVVRDGKTRFNSIALSPDGRFIFSGGLEGPNSSVKIWDTATGRPLLTLCPHSKGVACLALSPDGCQLLTGSEDKCLRVWDIEWELLSTDSVSTPTVQPGKPPTPSTLSPVPGIQKGAMPKLSGEFSLDDPKPKPSIFLDKGKPKS